MNYRNIAFTIYGGVILTLAGIILNIQMAVDEGVQNGTGCFPKADFPDFTGAACSDATVDAFRVDAIWGGLLALAFLAIVIGLGLWHRSHDRVSVWALYAAIGVGIAIGALVINRVGNTIEDQEGIAHAFWRGFGVTLAVAAALAVAGFWDNIQNSNNGNRNNQNQGQVI